SGDPDVVSKMVYLSTANGEVMYAALLLPNSATSAMYTNDTLELSLPLETQFLQPPPAGQQLGYYRGHLFVGSGDTLFLSEPFGYELFDYRKNIVMDGRITMIAVMEDIERITMSGGLQSGFFIGTTETCGVFAGTEMEKMQYALKTSYGAIEGAMTFVDGSLFGDDSAGARPLPMFLTTEGICVGVPGMDIHNITRTKYQFNAEGKGAALFMPVTNKLILTSGF
ncbi:MAG TPA: hypothetical protein VIY48_08495, partial [Candidatus Paceibacterota bacterium]